jgi:hypothetical protein
MLRLRVEVKVKGEIVQLECLHSGIWGTASLCGRVVTYKGGAEA